MIYPKSLKS